MSRGRFTARPCGASSAIASSSRPRSASEPASTMRPSVTSSADGRRRRELLPELVDAPPALLGAVAVHQDGVLLDGVRELDERLELLRRGAVVADPVLREAA